MAMAVEQLRGDLDILSDDVLASTLHGLVEMSKNEELQELVDLFSKNRACVNRLVEREGTVSRIWESPNKALTLLGVVALMEKNTMVTVEEMETLMDLYSEYPVNIQVGMFGGVVSEMLRSLVQNKIIGKDQLKEYSFHPVI
jgi:hypothetical protein